MKYIRKVCQLMGRCHGHWGDVRRLWRGVTFVSKCGSSKVGVSSNRKVCQLMERCDGYGGCKGVWEDVITFRRCDSPQGGVKHVRKVCQLMERCDTHGRSVQGFGWCDSCQKVCQPSGRCEWY